MNLHLGHESVHARRLLDLRSKECGLSEEEEWNLVNAMDKARLVCPDLVCIAP
jgi:hypothetical protein